MIKILNVALNIKMRFTIVLLFVLIITLSSCGDHDKKVVGLRQIEDQTAVIYRTPIADFFFEKSELIEYCKKENDGEPNDFTYPQIIEYITNFKENPIIIPDTLGTEMVIEKEVRFNESDSLIRVRDHDHPYASITEDVE